MSRFARSSGFSAVELLVTLAVAALLFAIGVPAMRDMNQDGRLRATGMTLVADFALARTEAIGRGASVSVCTSSDGSSCTNDGWGGTRLVFVDTDGSGTLDDGEALLVTSERPASTVAASASGALAANFVTFGPMGQLASGGALTLCTHGRKARTLRISRSGHASVVVEDTTCDG